MMKPMFYVLKSSRCRCLIAAVKEYVVNKQILLKHTTV